MYTLDLSRNLLVNIEQGAFFYTLKLANLFLQDNRLNRFHDNLFLNTDEHTSKQQKYVTTHGPVFIQLAGNKLTSLPNLQSHTKFLKTLNLKNNLIATVDKQQLLKYSSARFKQQQSQVFMLQQETIKFT